MRSVAFEKGANGSEHGVIRAGLRLPEQVFELCKDLLDWVEVRGVFGQEQELGSGRPDCAAHGLAAVAAEIVWTCPVFVERLGVGSV